MSTTQNDKNQNNKGRQIAALTGVVLLVALYIITLFVAIFDRSSSGKWFLLCLIATVALPLLIWIYIWLYGVITGRSTIASFSRKDGEEKKDPETESSTSEN